MNQIMDGIDHLVLITEINIQVHVNGLTLELCSITHSSKKKKIATERQRKPHLPCTHLWINWCGLKHLKWKRNCCVCGVLKSSSEMHSEREWVMYSNTHIDKPHESEDQQHFEPGIMDSLPFKWNFNQIFVKIRLIPLINLINWVQLNARTRSERVKITVMLVRLYLDRCV